jgi:hypothetical protein
MSNNINDLRKNIYNNNPNDFLLTLSDEELLIELYYSNDPRYIKSAEKIKTKYKTFDDWANSFTLSSKSAQDLKKEQELKQSPYNTKFVKSIADAYKNIGSPKIPSSSLDLIKNLTLLRQSAMPQTAAGPSVIDGIAGDTQNLLGFIGDKLTLGKARGPVGQTVADLGTLSKEIVVGADQLDTVRFPTPGKSKEEFKYTEIKPQKTIAGQITRGVGGYLVPFTSALKAVKAGTQATKFGKTLLETKPKITAGLQLYGATAATDQLVLKPEQAWTARTLGNYIGKDKEKLQTVLDYVSSSPDKTEGQNRVALLFDSIFVAGAIGGIIKIGGLIFRSGKDLFNYFKNIKENGTPQQKNQAIKVIEDASQNNPKSQPKAETFKDDIEIQETKFNSKLAEGTSWQFSESATKRKLSSIFNIFTKSRGTFSPKGFFTMNLNKNAAIATQSRGLQIKNEIDSISKKLIRDGKYTADDLNEIITVYLTQPNKDITKLIQKIFTKTEFDEFVKQQAKKSKFTADDLPIELKALADEARGHIDDLSKILIGSNYVSPELKKEIIENYGAYLRQSYKKFTNPNYKPSQEVFDEAVVFVAKQLKSSPKHAGKPDEVLEEMAIAQVNNLLRTARYSDDLFSFIDTVRAGKTGDVVFAERQKIAKEIQNLLGIETQASNRIFNSMTDLSQFISRQQTAYDLKQLGYNKYFFDDARGIFDAQILGKQYGALDGMWTTQEMALNFMQPLSTRESIGANVLKYLYSAKGFVQATKTVGNNITHIRNLESSGIIVLSNGLNPVSKITYDALKTAWSTIKPTNNKAINDKYNEYLRLGVTNQNAKLGDIRRLINEANKEGGYNYFDKLASKTGIKYLARQTEKAYVAEDDIWKIVVYENELATLKKAYPQTAQFNLEALKTQAANITRNTMPTYDMIPTGFKLLRYTPFGNYFAFHAERFRNTFHTYRIALEEIKSGNPVLKERGYRRLTGQITVGQTGNLMVASSSMYHTGVSREEDTNIKNIFKQSYHGNNWLYDVQDNTGNLLYADTKYTDPSAPVNDVILSPVLEYLNDENMTQPEYEDKLLNAFIKSYTNFVTPFIDTTILFDAVQDVTTRGGKTVGPDGTLFPIEGWDNTTDNIETKMNNFFIGINHLAKNAFLPVVVDNIKNTIEINKQQPDKYGVTKDKDLNRFKNITGINYQVINDETILKRITQKAGGFNFNRQGAVETLNQNVNKSNVTIAKLKNDYIKANRKYYLQFVDLKRTVNSALRLPDINPNRYSVTSEDIENALKESNIGLEVIEHLTLSEKRDSFVPLKFSNDNIDKIIQMNPTINEEELRNELAKLRFEFLQLPLLDMREDYTESQQQALDVLYEREKRFEGGSISLDFPVTDVKETAADRVDPFTGSPYSDQMARLGLAEGGIPLFEDRINNPSNYSYIKQGKELLTHRMAQSDNIVYPMIQLQSDGTLKDYGDDFEGARKEAIKNKNFKTFKTEDEAIAYAEGGYKTKEFNEYYNNERVRLGLQDGGVPEGAVRIYDEDQGLKPVMPVIELLSGVGIMRGGRVIKEVGEEIIEKKSVPRILYHGSPKRGLSEIVPSKELADNVYKQPGIFSNPLKERVVKFTGNKGAIYSLDTSNVSSFKNMLNISKNKVLNADNPSRSIITALDKEIKKSKLTPRTGLLKQDDLNISRQLESFKRDLLDKDNYISGIGPAATNFLKKQNVDVIKSTPNFRNPEKIPNYILLRDKIPVKDEFLTKLKDNKYYIQVD